MVACGAAGCINQEKQSSTQPFNTQSGSLAPGFGFSLKGAWQGMLKSLDKEDCPLPYLQVVRAMKGREKVLAMQDFFPFWPA